VELRDGSEVFARRLLVTTGLTDELPDVPGVAERFGRDVLHCPYCHGWEVRDRAIAVLSSGPMAVHQAQLFRQWSDTVTLLLHTGPAPTEAELDRLAARGITVVPGVVQHLEVADDALIGARLSDGRLVEMQALVVGPRMSARAQVLTDLGLVPTDQESGGMVIARYIAADPTGRTAVSGVWVAGNIANDSLQLIGAAAGGVQAAAAINSDLIDEEIEAAVADARALPGATDDDPFSAASEAALCAEVLGDRRHGMSPA
jgi:thioredoxin reductase